MRPKNSRRKRRLEGVQLEERDVPIPWSIPGGETGNLQGGSCAARLSYPGNVLPHNQRIQESFIPSGSRAQFPYQDENNRFKDRATLESVHQKLNLLLRDQSIEPHTSAYEFPFGASTNNFHSLNTERASICGTVSSNDVCTLFHSGQPSCSHLSTAHQQSSPPIGVFWDIENCQVPRGKSALVAVQRIRERFFSRFLEADFVCVCDIRKENAQVIQELNDASVSVVHVSGNSKNAADDKLRQAMRRFSDVYTAVQRPSNSSSLPNAAVLLISGDINFATDLSDLRYRKRLYVVLLHNKHAPEALIVCAHEHYDFHSILEDLPNRPVLIGKDIFQDSKGVPLKGGHFPMDVVVTDLPVIRNITKLKNRLKRLSDNCGGKVVTIQGQFAVLRFPNQETALRASKRMNGEDVFGSKIRVVYSSQMELKDSTNQLPNTSFPRPTPTGNTKKPNLIAGGSPQTWNPTWATPEQHLRQSATTFNLQTALPENQATSSCSSTSSEDSSREPSPPLASNRLPSSSIMPSKEDKLFPSMASVPSNPLGYSQSIYAIPQPLAFVSAEHVSHHQNGSPPLPQMFPSNSSFQRTVGQHGTENGIFNSPMMPMTGYFTSAPTLGAVQYQHQHSELIQTLSETSSNEKSTGQGGRNRIIDAETIDLHVTNIDPNIGDMKTVRQALMTTFGEHVTVRGVWAYLGQDGSISAVVRVPTKEEAHYAVAQLHRRNLGTKRIFISFGQGIAIDPLTQKKEVAALLQDVPSHSLPLFKFREMFEKRYRRSISASDLYRMKDVITISDSSSSGSSSGSSSFGNNGRNITLTLEWESKGEDSFDVYCKIHPPIRQSLNKTRQGWAEKEVGASLPTVILELKPFSKRVHSMLQSHNGGFPLLSFLDCYEAEFGEIETTEDGSGVPLEHLIACVQGVEISFSENGLKRVQWSEKKELETGLSQTMALQLAQLSRELVDLLKTFPKCSLPFSKLIPAYHHHFGRQCRVADYGHFSLSALLQTLPLTIQILGEAQDRIITLAHRAQMKRFATDLIRVLKAQGGVKKHIRMDEFSTAFSQVFTTRIFNPEDYGICSFEDLVNELVENSTLVTLIKDEDGTSFLAIPKREQTAQEIHRTRIFSTEVLDLLSQSIRCEMPFSKFIPSYHHHFGRQCRVSDYGFSKLAELFEAISDTVCVVSSSQGSHTDCSSISEDKLIRLTPREQIKVVGEQVWKLVERRENSDEITRISDLEELFLADYGFVLRPDLCEAESLEELILDKLDAYIQMDRDRLITIDRVQLEQFVHDAKSILEAQPAFTMDGDEFISEFSVKFNKDLDMEIIGKNLAHLVIITDEAETKKKMISLAPLRVFGREISELLADAGGFLNLCSLETAYLQKFGRPIRPAQLGYPTLVALLQALPDLISLRGKFRSKKIIVLNKGGRPLAEINANNPISSSSSSNFSLRGSKSYLSTGLKTSGHTNGSHHSKPQHAAAPFWCSNAQNMGSQQQQQQRNVYSPSLSSPNYSHIRAGEPQNVFTFDRPASLSPTMYDMWMRDGGNSPPMTPPVLWTYHPMGVLAPASSPPPGAGNVMIPTFSCGGQWSPPPQPNRPMMPSQCYEQQLK